MSSEPIEYVLDWPDLDSLARDAACRAALTLIAADMASAETDIPWDKHDEWPSEVVEAAQRLCARFVPEPRRSAEYMQTRVRSVVEPDVRRDFILVAPHAYDATFWRNDRTELASLADEGSSFVIWLTDQQRTALADEVGADHVVALADWRRIHPSRWQLWRDRVRKPGSQPGEA